MIQLTYIYINLHKPQNSPGQNYEGKTGQNQSTFTTPLGLFLHSPSGKPLEATRGGSAEGLQSRLCDSVSSSSSEDGDKATNPAVLSRFAFQPQTKQFNTCHPLCTQESPQKLLQSLHLNLRLQCPTSHLVDSRLGLDFPSVFQDKVSPCVALAVMDSLCRPGQS